MKLQSGYFSPSQAAKVCNVSHQTIIRCFDTGLLKGWKVPGSTFRRISREDLIEFARAHQLPIDMSAVME